MPRRNPVVAVLGNPRRKMSGRVHAVEYEHADDGELYRHDFTDGATMHAVDNGSAVEIRARGGTVRDFDGQPFLVNPRKGGTMAKKKRKPPGRYKSWAAWSRAMRNRKKGGTSKRRRKKSSARRNAPASAKKSKARKRSTGSTTMARRKRRAPARRRRRSAARSAPRRRRRSVRRNPPVVKRLIDGGIGAGQIIAGRIAVRLVPDVANLPKEGAIGIGVQAAVALVVGMVGRRAFGTRAGEMMLAGALTAPLETALVAANLPFISAALEPTSLPAGVGSYPQVRGVGSYPQVGAPALMQPGNGMGAYPMATLEDAVVMQQ